MRSEFAPLFVSWPENSALSRKAVWVGVMTLSAAFLREMCGFHVSFLSRRKVEGLFRSTFLRRASYMAKSALSLISSNFHLDPSGSFWQPLTK